MRGLKTSFITAATLITLAFSGLTHADETTTKPALEIIKASSIAKRGEPKYPANFKHWDYVNPNAPKGGAYTEASRGTFDNFNQYASRGSSPAGIEGLYDTLMVGNLDEPESYYGLIAETIEYPTDFSWIIFNINPKARFQDGKAITAEDVVFSHNLFVEHGVPQYRKLVAGVTVQVISPLSVRFTLPRSDKSLMLTLCSSTILPKHFYTGKSFSDPFKEPPLGSGSFKVSDYKMGQFIVYERIKDYWATNHPTHIGLNNFDKIRLDYYLDETVLMEAFKKGEYDIRLENAAKNWATQYTGEAFDKGYIVKEEITHQLPSGNQALVFNIQRPQFKDRKVRQALNLFFDFEWSNKNLFYNAYSRNFSHFMNTEYASSGLPSARELEILTPFKDQLPAELFTQEFSLNKTDGSGNIRKKIRTALQLFKQAGYQLIDKKLVDSDGKQFEFEIILYSDAVERFVIPFQKNLEKAGIKMNIRMLSDSSQYINRLREQDYDMTVRTLSRYGLPNMLMLLEWHSKHLDSGYNAVGTQDPMIDFLVDKIIENQENNAELIAYAQAFDRVLLWQHYSIPTYHSSSYRVAYWNKFARPETLPKYDLGQSSWWFDGEKAKKLPSKNQ